MRPDPPHTRFQLVWVGWWITLITVSDLYLIPPLLPNFLERFEITPGTGGWIAAFYQVGAAAITLVAGLLADRLGCRVVLSSAMAVFGLGELLSAVAPVFPAFLLGRVLVGAGSAAASLALTTYVGTHIPYTERGKVMGWMGSAYFAGVSLGPLAVTQVAASTNLSVLLLLFAALAFAGAIHARLSLEPEPAHSLGVSYRFKTYLKVFQIPGFVGLFLFQALFSIGVVGMVLYFGKWLEREYQLDTQWRGIIFALGGIPSIIGAPLGGWVCDWCGKKPFLVFLTAILGITTCIMPYLTDSLVGVVSLFGVIGLAAAARYSAFHAITTRLATTEELGRLVAMRNFLTYLATATGVVAMGWLFERSETSGYILMGWATTLCLAVSIPVLIRLVPGEPERENVVAAVSEA